jgi:hypothetical protein
VPNGIPTENADFFDSIDPQRTSTRSRANSSHLDSERFRSAPRTPDPYIGMLDMRQTGRRTGVACWYDRRRHRGMGPHVRQEASRIHHAARRRGGGLASRSAGGAGSVSTAILGRLCKVPRPPVCRASDRTRSAGEAPSSRRPRCRSRTPACRGSSGVGRTRSRIAQMCGSRIARC